MKLLGPMEACVDLCLEIIFFNHKLLEIIYSVLFKKFALHIPGCYKQRQNSWEVGKFMDILGCKLL